MISIGWQKIVAAALTLALALFLPTRASAADRDNNASVERSVDVQDLIYFGSTRPVLIRLHLLIDGKPFRQVWQSEVERLFAELDADGDGKITSAQADQIRDRLTGVFGTGVAIAAPAAEQPAASVSRDDVLARLDKTVPSIAIEYGVAVGRGAGPALFPLLDVDQNGRLSAEELKRAQELTQPRDFNDDRLITDQELILDLQANAGDTAARAPGESEIRLSIGAISPVNAKTQDAVGAAIGQLYADSKALAAKAPAVKENDETGPQTPLPDSGDGTNQQAASAFLERRPDVELYVGLGKANSARERSPRSGSSEIRVRKKIDGGFKLTLPDAEIALRRNNRNPNQQATDQIRVANYDADNNGYLENSEVEAVPFIAQAFDVIDADGDKKVFSAELRDFVQRQTSGAGARLLLEIYDQGQDLFSLLDADQDGILGPRELRTAENVLTTDDKNQDGQLGGSEIPQQITLVLSRGSASETQMMITRSRTRATPNRSARIGPLWFQKMDRNYDGDVSVDEFLGPRDSFSQMDADADGFIDADEAQSPGKDKSAGKE